MWTPPPCSYTQTEFTTHIDTDMIDIIVEIGAYDGRDSIELLNVFKPRKLILFEPDPQLHKIIEEHTHDYNQITANQSAVSDHDGSTDFIVVNREDRGFPYTFNKEEKSGMGSLLELHDTFYKNQRLIRHVIQVPVTRIDSYIKDNKVSRIDLLCIDAQGMSLERLKGAGEQLQSSIRYLILEAETRELYKNEKLLDTIEDYLLSQNFKRLHIQQQSPSTANCLYINCSLAD